MVIYLIPASLQHLESSILAPLEQLLVIGSYINYVLVIIGETETAYEVYF